MCKCVGGLVDARPRSNQQSRLVAGSPTTHEQPNVRKVYGELTVTKITLGPRGGIKSVECRCSCGRISTPSRDNLVAGKSIRCNVCAKKASGKTQAYKTTVPSPPQERLLDRICAIVSRCETRPTPEYGQRGIRVWPKWIVDRVAFLEYLAT